ncbi:MAG: ATP-binding protein [Blastocatellia bacterium]
MAQSTGLMRKPKGNSPPTSDQVNVSSQQQPSESVSSGDASDSFIDALTAKPEHVNLDKILPFLQERIAFKMPSDLAYLDGVLDYLNERMLQLGIVEPGDSDLLIALDEAIVNAVKHGNKCDPRKAVQVVAEFNAEGARFTVVDEGPGFARERVPDPTDPCRLLEPGGRGLLLINHIMDEVCFNQAGNRLEMFKRVSHGAHDEDTSGRRGDAGGEQK